tara:strand:- start:26 stop:172 length:147 start_codon:yes stop_codon:yes gene_type:complete
MDNKNDICITTGPIYSNKANVPAPKTNIKAISLVLLRNPSLSAALKIK